MTPVFFNGFTCTLMKHRYANGRVALSLIDEEGPVAMATVNLPDTSLHKNEVCVKDWSENEGMLRALIDAGVIEPTGRTVQSGFLEIPVCELQGPFREPEHAEAMERTRDRDRSR